MEWQVRTDAPGSYRVDLECVGTTDQVGNEGWVEADGRRLSFIKGDCAIRGVDLPS